MDFFLILCRGFMYKSCTVTNIPYYIWWDFILQVPVVILDHTHILFRFFNFLAHGKT